MRVAAVVGARPNFVKIAPLLRAMRARPGVEPLLVHTGQHYDAALAGSFFAELDLPPPDVSLEVGSGSHAHQTAEVMKRFEPALERTRPDLVVVVGDVNSTVAAALTAVKLGIPVAHVEAGLRSFDRGMPEEINRVVTDAISEYLFASEDSAVANLVAEGRDAARIHLVGNVMIDALEAFRPRWERSGIRDRLGVARGGYGLVTLHRPANVDYAPRLAELLGALDEVAARLPLLFPVHPRTRARLVALDGEGREPAVDGAPVPGGPRKLRCIEPLGYLDFLALMAGARLVLTDSGGIQEETTALGVPCLTLRDTTERPVTLTAGTNRLVGTAPGRVVEEAIRALEAPPPPRDRPPLWDGRAAERIVAVLREHAGAR
jgi:UDP-N-acetylglucosamine 2-epimerase (non-hydrolysing)